MMETKTYYAALMADGTPIPEQQKKLGTLGYGYKTQALANRYAPIDGFVEERHIEGCHDWAGRIFPKV